MVKFGTRHMRSAPINACEHLCSELNQKAFQDAPPELREIIRRHIGNALILQNALERYLSVFMDGRRDAERMRIYTIFGVTPIADENSAPHQSLQD